jgi:hypothetical protein
VSTSTINRYLGSCSLDEPFVPEAWEQLETKTCEMCGLLFIRPFAPTQPEGRMEWVDVSVSPGAGLGGIRVEVILRRDHGERFCHTCRGNLLQPDLKAQERYKERLPNAREGHHNRVYGMPDYSRFNPTSLSGRQEQMRSRWRTPRRPQ